MKKYIAKFKYWNGDIEESEIQKDWINDIVFAIEAQMFIANKNTGLQIKGSSYSNVDIFEVDS